MIKITDLVPGDRVRLVGFGGTDVQYRRRLLSLGVICGAELLIVRIAPLGCPIQIEVKGTALTLRIEEASQLILEHI
jgi:ferrous iron transport protein A